ncbi:transposase, partial [Salinibius halmophilus]|uniref:transposase n=1 Tax=Salinibius halmophilus TaxID=1853216 RepID=UPI001313F6D6
NRLEKAEYTETSDIVIRSLQSMIIELEQAIQDLTRDIDDHIDGHPHLKRDRQLLESIPGVGDVVSRIMLCILHAKGFRSAKQLAAYLGLIPRMRESGKFAGKTMITKAGPARFRAKLYMAAVSALKYSPDISALKKRLEARSLKGKQIVCAAMRKLVQICYGVVKSQTPYQAAAA